MSALTEKIKSVRPKVTDSDFDLMNGTIKGDYIKSWNHATEKQPTDEELG